MDGVKALEIAEAALKSAAEGRLVKILISSFIKAEKYLKRF